MLLKAQNTGFSSTIWEKNNYIQYLNKQVPANEDGATLIYDENVARQAERPYTWSTVIIGDSSDSVDFGTITGTLKGWIDTGSGWELATISSGLSGTVLTFQTGTSYKAFEDDNYVYIVESESTILVRLDKTTYAYQSSVTITSGDLGDLYDIDETVPLLPYSSDIRGLIVCDEGKVPFDYSGTTTNDTTYNGRKDFPLTPYQEQCFYTSFNARITNTDFSGVTMSASSTYKFRVLVDPYDSSWTSRNAIMGNQSVSNFFFGLRDNKICHWWGSTLTEEDTGLLLDEIASFYYELEITINSASSVDVTVKILDKYFNELFSRTDNSIIASNATTTALNNIAGYNGANKWRGGLQNLMIWEDSSLIHQIEFYTNTAKDDLQAYDRVTEDTYTITATSISNNIGYGQNVYSSRLVEGYTIQNDGSEDWIVPNNSSGAALTLSGYSVTETHSAGVYANGDINLCSPAWSRVSLVGSSNMDFYRNTTDANSNAVKDRVLLKLRYSREDDYPSFNTDNGDYFTLDTAIDLSDNADYAFEFKFDNYNSSRMVMGNSGNNNRAIGFQFGDVIAFHIGSFKVEEDCGLGLASRTEPFIVRWEFTRSGSNTTNIMFYVYDGARNELWRSPSAGSLSSVIAQFTDIGNKGAGLGDPVDADILWGKYYKDGSLVSWWKYAGDEQLILQDSVSGNNGTLTTGAVADNQITQPYENPFRDGQGTHGTYGDTIAKYPSNGEDAFDVTLTTSKPKIITKAEKYTNND